MDDILPKALPDSRRACPMGSRHPAVWRGLIDSKWLTKGGDASSVSQPFLSSNQRLSRKMKKTRVALLLALALSAAQAHSADQRRRI
jgi:hypothetical protein